MSDRVVQVVQIPRQEFLEDYWNYQPGQHVSLIAPTQNGKTTFAQQLLDHTDTEWCSVPPVVLVAKPKDPVVARWIEQAEFKEIGEWPPHRLPFRQAPPGYGLWPRHLRDVDNRVNAEHLRGRFQPAIRELFWKGNTILVADEVYYLCVELGLSDDLTRHWTQGAGMGSGLWTATQKPSGTQGNSVPSFMYNSPTHTFLGRDPDKRNRDRFGEIGGVDPKMVGVTVMNLRKYEWLYIHRDGPTMCVVGA